METQFPVGGSRQKVYDYLQSHGFVMSKWSDKSWMRADGLELQLYGSGSCARIIDTADPLDHKVKADGPLKKVVEAL